MTVGPRLGAALCALSIAWTGAAFAEGRDWVDVGYGELVDRRQLSHSGEPVGSLLGRLSGRALDASSDVDDRTAHTLLDPLLEPYAFVLPDAIDTLEAARGLVEIGRLWQAGETQPAWAELLRARRYVIESDGAGHLRAFLPVPAPIGPGESSVDAARRAYEAAWPVLRHVLEAERARLRASNPQATLSVEARAFLHMPERSAFRLGRSPWVVEVRDTASGGARAPLDLGQIREFLDSGLELEGGRLLPDGSLTLLGSRPPSRPTLLGAPVGLGDLAVAYRAVFHGGLAEPYMSLDRGLSPQTSIVNYGGRLRDTAPGMISLLCDMRFKTFSQGLDLPTGDDLRRRVRTTVPGFRSHLERIAEDPESAGFVGQQTRLWFYPDTVDLTVSSQSDVLAMRRVRMAAASERVEGETTTTIGEDRSWTKATVAEINHDYDGLARYFPEMSDLDEVVRLLSLFTWLREADRAGLPIPDLDVLLAVDVPSSPTPRTFPQLLAFNALPPPGSRGEVVVYDRVDVGDALERLNPSTGPALPARVRFERARAGLDPGDRQMAALLDELSRVDPASTDEITLDVLAYRAERLRMHELVLSTLGAERTAPLLERETGGEHLRVFSVGIGGLDLGMGPALARAQGRSLGMGQDTGGAPEASSSGPAPAASSHGESVGVPVATIPPYGAALADGEARIESRTGKERGFLVRTGESGVDVSSRQVVVDGSGRAARIVRFESERRSVYSLVAEAGGLRAAVLADKLDPPATPEPVEPTPDLEVWQLGPGASGAEGELTVYSSLGGGSVPVPRADVVRLLLGRDLSAGDRAPWPFSDSDDRSSAVEARMILSHPSRRSRPWESPPVPLPAEVDPQRVARAIGAWDRSGPAVVVGTDPSRSPARWAAAASVAGEGALLVLPADGFPGRAAPLRDQLARAFAPGVVATELPSKISARIVLLVSHEAPDRFAARLRALARNPGMRGKLLAAWSLGGPLRDDLPAWILAESGILALGMGEPTALPFRGADRALATFREGVLAGGATRVERVAGPFLWYY